MEIWIISPISWRWLTAILHNQHEKQNKNSVDWLFSVHFPNDKDSGGHNHLMARTHSSALVTVCRRWWWWWRALILRFIATNHRPSGAAGWIHWIEFNLAERHTHTRRLYNRLRWLEWSRHHNNGPVFIYTHKRLGCWKMCYSRSHFTWDQNQPTW